MPSSIFVGDLTSQSLKLDEYIGSNNILPYEIEEFSEELSISQARLVKKTLSFSINGSKLFVFKNSLTTESQNSLLKTLEESKDNIHFIFFCTKIDELLPTINSRSIIKRLAVTHTKQNEIDLFLEKICQLESPSYSDIDQLLVLCKNDLYEVMSSLRNLMLDNTKAEILRLNSYKYCKGLLPLIPFVHENNVSKNAILESAFLVS